MHPDEETNLRKTFAELQRRQGQQAPPFEIMRERAFGQAADRQSMRQHSWVARRLAGATAVAFLIAISTWWIGRLPKPDSPILSQADSMNGVDALITAIEQHLEQGAPLSIPEYPTDVLLAEYQTDFSE